MSNRYILFISLTKNRELVFTNEFKFKSSKDFQKFLNNLALSMPIKRETPTTKEKR